MTDTIKTVWAKEGPRGFFRGVIPPMWGSAVYRGGQFTVFEAVYTKLKDSPLAQPIPGTGGIEGRTILAGFLGASARSVLESPIEYCKGEILTRTNAAQSAFTVIPHIAGIMICRGYGYQWGRTAPMMTIYFVSIDSVRLLLCTPMPASASPHPSRHTDLMTHTIGQYVASGGCASFGFCDPLCSSLLSPACPIAHRCTWPMETLKNTVQANTQFAGVDSNKLTLRQRVAHLGGIPGLYRVVYVHPMTRPARPAAGGN
eukprot:gene3423-649_t